LWKLSKQVQGLTFFCKVREKNTSSMQLYLKMDEILVQQQDRQLDVDGDE
jgi:hypothetical protein